MKKVFVLQSFAENYSLSISIEMFFLKAGNIVLTQCYQLYPEYVQAPCVLLLHGIRLKTSRFEYNSSLEIFVIYIT